MPPLLAMATRFTECAIELNFDRRDDGRFHIHSPDLPGLHLIGPSPDALVADLDSVLKDMLHATTSQAVDTMLAVPNFQNLGGYAPAGTKRELRVITFKQAR
jgi:predicted RNase H-like HicB family nuclease